MSSYTSISYISKILWRFYGGANPDDPSQGIQDIKYVFTSSGIKLAPFFGQDGKKIHYTRQILFEEETTNSFAEFNENSTIKENSNILFAKEPKAVCFCDIPISHLSLHMKKYNSVGIGINRDSLAEMAKDLQPVHYFFIRNKADFNKSRQGIFKLDKKSKTVLLESYVKIPTLFRENHPELKNNQEISHSEKFDSIYEEREWRLFNSIEIPYNKISFLLLPSKEILKKNKKLFAPLINAHAGIIYAEELFPRDLT